MAEEKPVKFGIVGADRAGAFYARALAHVRGAVLTAVCDPDILHAQNLAWEHNATPYASLSQLLAQADAAVITSPAAQHYQDALCCLQHGVHTLVEKPLAAGLDQAKELIDTARRENRVLQVGHLERFNPATVEAAKHICEPKFITVERLTPYNPKDTHLGAVMDLMLQDLDLLLTLVPYPVVSIDATGLSVFSDKEDLANTRLRFADGTVADLTASRAGFERKRVLHAFQKDGYVSVDFLNERVRVYRKDKPVLRALRDISVVYPKVEKQPPLAGELTHFIQCIRRVQTPDESTLSALELALKITERIHLFDVPKTGRLHTPKPLCLVSDAAAAARIALDEAIGQIKRED